jgi:hypothetical protein
MQNAIKPGRHLSLHSANVSAPPKLGWRSALELDGQRAIVAGSQTALCQAIGRGADLKILTEFAYNQHVDVQSPNSELVREVSEFPVTYLVEDRWSAGIMSLRMPIDPPEGFGPRASMSFFMYNQDGRQAIARPYLDGLPASGKRGSSAHHFHPEIPKYHQYDSWDAETNAPSSNFVYEFERYRYLVRDDWQEVLSHRADGTVDSGSLLALADAAAEGKEIKVGIRNLCGELYDSSSLGIEHTVFVKVGPVYHFTDSKVFCAGTHPVVRVRPGIPMRYESGNWDFGWLMPRSDGFVDCWICDPYTLRFDKKPGHYEIRWFVR